MPIPPTSEPELVLAARGGDERAYEALVEPHRAQLHAHCYRMLGSIHDADDAMQETLLRAWRSLPTFEGRGPVRSWLFQIATNASLRLIERRPRRLLPLDHGPPAAVHDAPGEPLVESIWIEPYPDQRMGVVDGLAAPDARYEQRESVELAFVAAVQHLSARQRAVLLLHDVLGFSAREIAQWLETTVAAVNSAVQRARDVVAERVPMPTQQATLRSLGDQRQREIVACYIDAWDRADVEALVAMLRKDATWSMPPASTWYQGIEAVTAFLAEWSVPLRWRNVPARANGQLAIGCYLWSEVEKSYQAFALDVLTLRGEQIQAVTSFLMPDAFLSLGLPAQLS